MERREWYRKASNGLGKIYEQLWQDEKQREKKGIVCVIHGMQGHLGSYAYLFRALAEEGYVVCGQDLQGHGRSASVPGYFGERDGFTSILHDVHRMLIEVRRWYPGLPLFLFGHSMGSFVARDYAATYPGDVSGLLLSGTAGPNILLRGTAGCLSVLKRIRGGKAEGKQEGALMAKYFCRGIREPESLLDWVCTKKEVLYGKVQDPLQVGFTVGAYKDLVEELMKVNRVEEILKLKATPMLLVSGGADPVGEYGKGPATVYGILHEAGNRDVTMHIYPGLRHEILNEDVREEVIARMLRFLQEQVERGKNGEKNTLCQ